jgi:hypothetical protein
MNPLRLLSVAAALVLTAGSGTAAAQTLYVRRTPAGSTVDLVVNTTKAGSAKADAAGDVRIPFDLPALTKKEEIDARVYVDTCGEARRVLIAERDVAPLPPEESCTRQELIGVFLVRRVSSLVVNVATPVATLLLRQGSYSLQARGPRRQAPQGFVVFGGGVRAKYTDAVSFGCADVPVCEGNDAGYGYTAGAEYWFGRYIAAEGSYFKPPELTIVGSSTGYRFNSFFEPHLFTVAGKVGVPIGPVRLYGRAGFNYHRGESGTTQHTDETSTIDENGVVTITPARDVTVEAETKGWAWLVGGGIEVWVAPKFALYAEAGTGGVKGDSGVVSQGRIDDRLISATAGVKVSFGR